MMFIPFALLALVGYGSSQDTNPCLTYDTTTATATCNGTKVDVINAICGESFSKTACTVSQTLSDGRIETYFFKGTPTGLPAAAQIQSDCDSADFPANGGVAVAQTYQNQGQPAGCYPAADITGSTMTYTLKSDGTLASVTVNFNIHTDGSGNQRDAFIKITCTPNAKPPYTYSTVGDQGHPSQYEIDVLAPCEESGGGGSGSGAGGSSSTGWILVGLLIGVSAAYFGGGYVYLWKVKGAEGRERIPQVDFWSSLPGLIKDGFRFTKAKATRSEYTAL